MAGGGSMEHSKFVLDIATQTARENFRATQAGKQESLYIRAALSGVEALLNNLKLITGNARASAVENAAAVSMATRGHQKSDPARGVQSLRMADGQLEDLQAKITEAGAKIREIHTILAPVDDMLDRAGGLFNQAADTFERYRNSY